MRIVKAKIQDLNEIVSLEKSRFLDAWNFSQWENEFTTNDFAFIYLLKDKEKLIGYIDFWILFEQATISKICVHQDYLRLGLGDKLLKRALKKIDKENCLSTSLEVRVSNVAAIKLYAKNLFKTVLTKKNYYQDGEDAFFMIRSIGDVYEG